MVAAYCNDNYLVILGTNVPSHTDGLASIPRPPGYHDASGGGASYATECVFRYYSQALVDWSIPLSPQLLSNDSINNNKAAFSGQTQPSSLPGIYLPGSGPMAVSVSGLEIFPLFNNVGVPSHSTCEMDKCSAHSAGDYHYHGDPYSDVAGDCMYSPADYSSYSAHPPLIGWSFDGYDIYGRHLSTSAVGYSVPLDLCGGHSHVDANNVSLGYHYHTQVVQLYTTDKNIVQSYYAYVPGPFYCWRGNISVSKFFNNNGPLVSSRANYASLQPCCSTSAYYLKSGYSFSGVTIVSANPTSIPTAKPTAPTPQPTLNPTANPSPNPTTLPTVQSSPTVSPTALPTPNPSFKPSSTPTVSSTPQPSTIPSLAPSSTPTVSPTPQPSTNPSLKPSSTPSVSPTVNPSSGPTRVPTPSPTFSSSDTFVAGAPISCSQFLSSSQTAKDFLNDGNALTIFINTIKSLVKRDCVVSITGASDGGSRRLNPLRISRALASGFSVSYDVTVYFFNESSLSQASTVQQNVKNNIVSGVSGGSFLSLLQASSSTVLSSVTSTPVPTVVVNAITYTITSSPTKSPSSSSSSSNNKTIIIAAAAGGGGALLVAILIYWFTCKAKVITQGQDFAIDMTRVPATPTAAPI